ncbi:MAG: hypothetical protein J2P48_16695, partial [Alphaproteobacteria bacterium]|nr:hypothetical protein [Alphaproteobacteria bacterium]
VLSTRQVFTFYAASARARPAPPARPSRTRVVPVAALLGVEPCVTVHLQPGQLFLYPAPFLLGPCIP